MAETGRLRLNVGLNSDRFAWELKDSQTFESPEAVMAWSGNGLEGISHELHHIYRQRLIPRRWRYNVCPVLINTWEAMYFGVSHEKVVTLAKHAAEIGTLCHGH